MEQKKVLEEILAEIFQKVRKTPFTEPKITENPKQEKHTKTTSSLKSSQKDMIMGENTNDCRLTTSNGGGEKAMK